MPVEPVFARHALFGFTVAEFEGVGRHPDPSYRLNRIDGRDRGSGE
jgi:hypothetical protein